MKDGESTELEVNVNNITKEQLKEIFQLIQLTKLEFSNDLTLTR